MKICKLTHGLICLTLLTGTSAITVAAMPKQDTGTPPPAAGYGAEAIARERLKAAVDELNLSDGQKANFGPIFDDAKTKTDAVRSDSTLTQRRKRPR